MADRRTGWRGDVRGRGSQRAPRVSARAADGVLRAVRSTCAGHVPSGSQHRSTEREASVNHPASRPSCEMSGQGRQRLRLRGLKKN